jgi:predicted component of type VI protein secretion system
MMSFDSFNYFTRNSEMDVNFSVENSLKKEESSLKKDSFNNLSILSPESVRILSL